MACKEWAESRDGLGLETLQWPKEPTNLGFRRKTEPSRHTFRILCEGFRITRFEVWLFDEDNDEVKGQKETAYVERRGPGCVHRRKPEGGYDNAHVHRVSRITIEPAANETARFFAPNMPHGPCEKRGRRPARFEERGQAKKVHPCSGKHQKPSAPIQAPSQRGASGH